MKKLYLANTLVSVQIVVGSLIPSNSKSHQNVVWADDEAEARAILETHHAKDTDPTRTKITVWLSEALGDPIGSAS